MLVRSLIIAVLCSAFAAPPARAADSAQTRYRDALANEQALRADPNPSSADYQAVIRAYEAIVRRYPTSGYSDNALWQAAALARELFARTGNLREQDRALRLLRSLVSEYPSSKLVPAAVVEITRLSGAADSPAPRRAADVPAAVPIPSADSKPSTSTKASIPAAPIAAPSRRAPVTLKTINRVVLPEVVRLVIELDGEVLFHHERIDGPPRVFVDLLGTQPAPVLRDAELAYGDDIIRRVRIGRHPPNTTRVVLDVDNLSRYSFFTLYEPFRLVIDCERAVPAGIPSAAASAAPSTRIPAESTAAAVLPDRALVLPAVTLPPAAPASLPAQAPSAAAPLGTRLAEPISSEPVTGSAARPAATPAPPSSNAAGGFSIARQLGLGASRIVIDPGHGGHDPGALKNRLSEAGIVLDIALRLEKLLLKQPAVEVVLTRRTDTYVSLEERTAIANREGADLFLSIHVNSSPNTGTRGVETYFLNFATTADAEAVAARENASSGRTMNSLPDIIKAITLNNKRDESRDFGRLVQRALMRQLRTAGMKDLGVKQAPFVVLIGAEMPSVLAEVAFLTNRQDEQLLKKASYRQRIADALLNGVLQYQQALKKTTKVTRSDAAADDR